MIDVGVLRIPLKAMQNCTSKNITDVLITLASHFKLLDVTFHSQVHMRLVRDDLVHNQKVVGVKYTVSDHDGLTMRLQLEEPQEQCSCEKLSPSRQRNNDDSRCACCPKRAEAQRHA